MKILGIVGASIGAIVLILGLSIGLGLFDLQWQKYFSPRKENIRRQVFEQTQSYVHGKSQDLAKYFDEYRKSDSPSDREAIRQIIIMRYAEFDASKLQSPALKNFLTQQRGY